MINIIGIGGLPATGKTTVVKGAMSNLGSFQRMKSRLLEFSVSHETGCVVLGRYLPSDGTFAGTDRLSMAVMPDALLFLEWVREDFARTVIFEGDRLFCDKYLTAIECNRRFDSLFILLQASPSALAARHIARGDKQTSPWLAGRATKLDNLRKSHALKCWKSESYAPAKQLSDYIAQAAMTGSLDELRNLTI